MFRPTGWRFGLRFSLCAFAVFGGLLFVSLPSQRTNRQLRLLAEIERAGGDVEFRNGSGKRVLGSSKEYATAITDRSMFPDRILLNDSGGSKRAIKHLGLLPELRALSLTGRSFDDSDIELIADLELKELELNTTSLTARGISHIVQMMTLEDLTLVDARIDDDVVPALASMRSLSSLFISGTDVSPQGAYEIRNALPNCRVKHLTCGAPQAPFTAKVERNHPFAAELDELKEPSLIGSWFAPFALRVTRMKEGRLEFVRMIERNDGTAIATIWSNEAMSPLKPLQIDAQYQARLKSISKQWGFRQMPREEPREYITQDGTMKEWEYEQQGECWVLEITERGRLHTIVRSNPDDRWYRDVARFRRFCDLVLNIESIQLRQETNSRGRTEENSSQ